MECMVAMESPKPGACKPEPSHVVKSPQWTLQICFVYCSEVCIHQRLLEFQWGI